VRARELVALGVDGNVRGLRLLTLRGRLRVL
jgi:hypothetical protein